MPQELLTPPTPGRRNAMKLQRTKDTWPEVALRRALRQRGLRYRLHVRLLPDVRRSSDIVFSGARVVIDVRGCYWHGCPDHARRGSANAVWWSAKIAANVSRDEDTVRRLTEAGWHVVVVWEHEDPNDAATKIEALIRAGRQT